MNRIRYTLLTDGPSDRCLMRPINWVLDSILQLSQVGYVSQFADLRYLPDPPSNLADRMRSAIRMFPCEVLFVHRDAEGDPRQQRVDEINESAVRVDIAPHIPVIPVRMTEAWLLIEEQAIRGAAGNPNGVVRLELPSLQDLEDIPNPKALLRELLLDASERRGRRREKLKRVLPSRIQRVADLVSDFAPLRLLTAFNAFERETRSVLQDHVLPEQRWR